MAQGGGAAVWQGMRTLAALRDGYRCRYCGVPSAATIEHVDARSKGGGSGHENLILACPYCNTRKGDRPLELFMQEERWKLERPADLPADGREMLARYFGFHDRSGIVSTSSTNSKLELRDGVATLLVRAAKRDEWKRFKVGPINDPRVCAAVYDFLSRHYTPSKPKAPKPTKAQFAKGKGKGHRGRSSRK